MISSFLVACILICTAAGSASAATAGGQDDPLISKSYIDNTYPALVLSEPQELLANSVQVLEYKLQQAQQTTAPTVTYYYLDEDGSFSLSAGSGFSLLTGGARVSSCSGTIIDLTTGTTFGAGQTLTKSHMYLAAENATATVTLTEASKISTFGSVDIIGGNLCSFTDVTESNWFYDDVVYAVKKGLINGRSATIFDPESSLSIAEAIKIAACMYQQYSTGSVTLTNGSPAWYDSYVSYALENGIITHTYSNYDAYITRSEFIAIIYRAMPSSEYTVINSVADDAIPDVKMTDENADSIYAFYRAGIVIGNDTAGTFNPSKYIWRSEISATINRMYEKSARKTITLE